MRIIKRFHQLTLLLLHASVAQLRRMFPNSAARFSVETHPHHAERYLNGISVDDSEMLSLRSNALLQFFETAT